MDRYNLQALARLYGVYTTYADVWGTPRHASNDTILRTLELLDAPLASADQAADAIVHRRQQLWREMVAPVMVAWDARLASFDVRLSEALPATHYRVEFTLEDGGTIKLEGQVNELPVCRHGEVAGEHYVRRTVRTDLVLPHGYHRLKLFVDEQEAESLVIAAPMRAFESDPENGRRLWGVFMPLYALHRKTGAESGNFGDLEALMEWTSACGGNLVATLPLLSTLWELTDDPSPYNPASRLFWNEFYLDVKRVPGGEAPGVAAALSDSQPTSFGTDSHLLNYATAVDRKRRILEKLARDFFAGGSQREALAQYCRENPDVQRFAQFRAAGEQEGRPWPLWPEPLRSGAISQADYRQDAYRYHLFTQWQVDMQLEALAQRAQRLNLLWYLDFPLGVAGAGYDVWREPDLFVRDASGGAPPDSFFTKGQDWGFPPMRPDRLRRQGYAYFIRALRNHLRRARVLRFDHVMGLYRLYWIPHGFPATEGAYVRYPIDELCAILNLESHRFGARIVGENLGTVPAAVDQALLRHGMDDMYVLQYETNPERGSTLRTPQPTAVASVNTHDMPQFAAYWQGLDIEDRVELGLFTKDEAAGEQARRKELRRQLTAFLNAEGLLDSEAPTTSEVLEACQAYLARSPASIVQVNLEDLWGETEPQNCPGTFRERPNWRRKAKYPLEVFTELPEVRRVLETVDRLRRL